MGIARRIAHLTYRTADEVDARFGRNWQGELDPLRGGQWAVQSYLRNAEDGLRQRFDAGSYVALTGAMNSHEIGRGRGGTAAALRGMRAKPTVVGVDSDRLYPLRQQVELAAALHVEPRVLRSDRGHDAFLVEVEQINVVLREAMA
jgi:homoserine O-acetyltransferase